MTRVQFFFDNDLDKLQTRANKFIDKVEKMGCRIVNVNISGAWGGLYSTAIVYTNDPK